MAENAASRPVSKRLRYEILRRDNHQCRYCGATAPDVKLTVDHVVPVTLGGDNAPANLVAACHDCNAGKSSVNPDSELVQQVEEDALRWNSALRLAAEQMSRERGYVEEIVDEFVAYWDRFEFKNGALAHLPNGWQSSVRTWVERGLSNVDLFHAIDVSMNTAYVARDDKWKYCCGVAWGMVTELEHRARELIDEGII